MKQGNLGDVLAVHTELKAILNSLCIRAAEGSMLYYNLLVTMTIALLEAAMLVIDQVHTPCTVT